jgi:hypothetical protein
MADLEDFDSLGSEEEFWQGQANSPPPNPRPRHGHALRGWLYLAAKFRDQFLDSEDDITACSQRLLASDIFRSNKEYVRTQIIYSLLQEDVAGPLHVIASFLLLDGRADESTFRRMIDEACFPRLLELINGRKEDDPRLHRLLLHLMYEMSRMERLRVEDMVVIDDSFVAYLFSLIEGVSDDVNDPYHYPTIRVLVGSGLERVYWQDMAC